MEYIIVGNTAYIAGFTGEFDELVNYFPATLINSLDVLGVTRMVWGQESENWIDLEDFPRLEN